MSMSNQIENIKTDIYKKQRLLRLIEERQHSVENRNAELEKRNIRRTTAKQHNYLAQILFNNKHITFATRTINYLKKDNYYCLKTVNYSYRVSNREIIGYLKKDLYNNSRNKINYLSHTQRLDKYLKKQLNVIINYINQRLFKNQNFAYLQNDTYSEPKVMIKDMIRYFEFNLQNRKMLDLSEKIAKKITNYINETNHMILLDINNSNAFNIMQKIKSNVAKIINNIKQLSTIPQDRPISYIEKMKKVHEKRLEQLRNAEREKHNLIEMLSSIPTNGLIISEKGKYLFSA